MARQRDGAITVSVKSRNRPSTIGPSRDPVHLYDPMTLTLTPAAAASDAPEPGSWLLCLAGATILLATARRFNRPSISRPSSAQE